MLNVVGLDPNGSIEVELWSEFLGKVNQQRSPNPEMLYDENGIIGHNNSIG